MSDAALHDHDARISACPACDAAPLAQRLAGAGGDVLRSRASLRLPGETLLPRRETLLRPVETLLVGGETLRRPRETLLGAAVNLLPRAVMFLPRGRNITARNRTIAAFCSTVTTRPHQHYCWREKCCCSQVATLLAPAANARGTLERAKTRAARRQPLLAWRAAGLRWRRRASPAASRRARPARSGGRCWGACPGSGGRPRCARRRSRCPGRRPRE